MPVPIILLSAIDFSHHDIDAAEDHHHIGDGVAKAKIFKHSEINETRRTDPIAIRVRTAVADQIKSELAFRSFDASVGFAGRRTKCAELDFWVNNGSRLNLCERLLENLDALVHLERPHHQAIISVAMVSEWNSKFKSWINAVTVHFANVVIHAAGAQHRAGDSRIDCQLGRKFSNVLSARAHDLVLQN